MQTSTIQPHEPLYRSNRGVLLAHLDNVYDAGDYTLDSDENSACVLAWDMAWDAYKLFLAKDWKDL